MAVRHRILVAAQPGAWMRLQRLLDAAMDLVPVHSRPDALQELEHDPQAIDLIVSTIAFDDSRMVEFLQAVKADPEYSRIPFLCARILPSVLSDHMVSSMRQICKECGAVDLLDLANLPPETARGALRSAVDSCLASGRT